MSSDNPLNRTQNERLAAIELQLQALTRAVGRIEGSLGTVKVFALAVSGLIAAVTSAATTVLLGAL